MLVALVGCQKRSEVPAAAHQPPPPSPVTVEVVKPAERSKSFLAVNRHLELGGTLYGYVDIDGDVTKAASNLQPLLAQVAQGQPALAPLAKQNLAAIATTLGLTDIKAIGFSSVPDGTGYFRNRVFLYTPEQRHGLLLGLGGKPGPFTHLNLAPADTAFYAEAQTDVPAVYQTIKAVVAQVAGEPASNNLETVLQNAGEKAAFSFLDLIHNLKGHSAVVLRMDPTKTIALPLPGGAKLPEFSLLVCVDGIAPVVEPTLNKSPLFKRSDAGQVHIYELTQPSPIPQLQPVIVADGSTLYFATTRAFLDECRGLTSGLAQTPQFKSALAAVGTDGNGLTYVAPQFFDGLRRIQALNPNLPAQPKQVMSVVMANLPKMDRPIIALRTNLPDGILVRSYWNRSLKQDVALAAMYNPVSLGLVAAMAIPAFQKVRQSSQQKAVLNNLRMLSSAADEYYLEKGVTTATYDDLVGPGPNKYIRQLPSVAGEDYRTVHLEQGQPLRVRLPDGRVVKFQP